MIDRLASREVYANRWMRVREDDVRFADGSTGIYGVVEKPDFALIVPWDGTAFWLVEQHRYPVGARFWEFPQGSWDDRRTDRPADAARPPLRGVRLLEPGLPRLPGRGARRGRAPADAHRAGPGGRPLHAGGAVGARRRRAAEGRAVARGARALSAGDAQHGAHLTRDLRG